MSEERAPEFINKDNALLWAELQTLKQTTKTIAVDVKAINGRVKASEIAAAVNEERWKTHRSKHKDVDRNNVIASAISGGLAFVGAIIAGIFGIRP